jgi:hypothetical protein
VNLDHMVVRTTAAISPGAGGAHRCVRGHERTPANIVRRSDGRIAYCRICRNERRRERYQRDRVFARHEKERQRRLRGAKRG